MSRRQHGVGRVYKRGNRWWLDFYGRRPDGRRGRIREPGGDTRTAAKALLEQRIAEQSRGHVGGRSAWRLTLDELLDQLLVSHQVDNVKSIKRTRSALKPLRRFFSDRRALEITAVDIDYYILERRAQGVVDGTIGRELNVLRSAYRQAVIRAKTLPTMPYIKTLTGGIREGFVTDEQMAVLLAVMPAWLARPTEFTFDTGWRMESEVLSLRWSQVNFEDGIVRLAVGSTKNKDGREYPFARWPELEALLIRQRDDTQALERETGRSIPWVFHKNGRRFSEHWRKPWNACCRKVGLDHGFGPPGPKHLIPHDLRRSAIMRMERQGIARSVATSLSGHKSEQVYRRYAIACHRDQAEAVERLAKAQYGHN